MATLDPRSPLSIVSSRGVASACFVAGRRLAVLLLEQLAERRIRPCLRDHRLVVRIRLELLLVFFVDVLVVRTSFLIGRPSFARIDVVLVRPLAAHGLL